MNPLVSVIMPTYNRPDLIVRALESIVHQDYAHWELIIADDNIPGSPEDFATIEAIAPYVVQYPITIMVTGGSVGGGKARNMACRKAQGTYLAFLDDDDAYEHNKLSEQVLFMEENHLDLGYQDVSWYNDADKLLEFRTLDHAKGFSQSQLLMAHMLKPIAPSSIYMIRRDYFFKTEGFGEVKTGQDWHLMLRCIEAGGSIGYQPGCYVRQYRHAGERLSTGQNKIDGEIARHEVVRGYYELLDEKEQKEAEFRHYAALAYACLKSKMDKEAWRYAWKALCAYPLLAFKQGIRFIATHKS